MTAGWRIAAVGAGLAGYALMSHLLMVHAARAPWAVAVLFGPLVFALAAAGWQRRQPLLLALCAAGVALLASVVARGGAGDVNRMYVLQHAGIHLALAWLFGSTLRAGAQPFITVLAQSLHARLNLRFGPDIRAYTRWVTQLWTLYFVAMVVLSLLVYALAPWAWWSVFANLLTPLSAALVMVGEHVHRYRRHPDFDRVSMTAAVAAYWRSGPATAAPDQGSRR